MFQGSGFSHGWSYQRGREDDTGHHIQRRQLHRLLPPSFCYLQQAWQLHRGRCVHGCVCMLALILLLTRKMITQLALTIMVKILVSSYRRNNSPLLFIRAVANTFHLNSVLFTVNSRLQSAPD